MRKVGKSNETLKKEAQLQELEKRRKKIQTTIKSLRTRLHNTKTKVDNLSREIVAKSEAIREKTSRYFDRVRDLLTRLKDDKRFRPHEQTVISELYAQFHDDLDKFMHGFDPETLFEGFEEEEFWKMFEGLDEPEPEQDDHWRQARKQATDKHSPEKEEKKDIRKLYIALSKRLHPDRANNQTEEANFHQLQLQVNEAYEKHDYQVLLDLWHVYCLDEAAELKGEMIQHDVLLSQIDRLERECELLESQKIRLSDEIRELRQSELGKMLTYRDSMPHDSVEDLFGISEGKDNLVPLQMLLEQLEASDKKGKLHPALMALLIDEEQEVSPPRPRRQKKEDQKDKNIQLSLFDDEPESHLPRLDIDDEDFDDGEFDGEESESLFQIGEYVKISGETEFRYYDDEGQFIQIWVKRMKGWVCGYAYNFDIEDFEYEIELDLASFKKLPPSYLEAVLIRDGFSADRAECIPEEQLNPVPRKRWPNKKKETVAVRKAHWDYLLDKDLDAAIREKIYQVVLSNLYVRDCVKWHDYIRRVFKCPFKAIARDVNGIDSGTPVEVVEIGDYKYMPLSTIEMVVRPIGTKKKYRSEFYCLEPMDDPEFLQIWKAYRIYRDNDILF